MKQPTPPSPGLGLTALGRRSAASLAAILITSASGPGILPALAVDKPRALDERIDGETALPQLAREYAVRQFGPQPRQLPRRRLDLDFAVLLMRSSYTVADDLDFMPMNDFQKKFFLLRQNEWDSYRDKVSRVRQGDLADPNYFDFISYCQYATISAGMRNGKLVFNELIDSNGTSVIVTRDPSIGGNEVLPASHAMRVGEAVLDAVFERYPGLAPEIPAQPTCSALLDGVRAIARVFEYTDYQLTSRLTPTSNGFELSVIAPATLWSQQVLTLRGDIPNDFEAKAIQSYLRRCSVAATYTTRYSGSEVAHNFRWPEGLQL